MPNDTPKTLPPDFFQKQATETPQTLPPDFFSSKAAAVETPDPTKPDPTATGLMKEYDSKVATPYRMEQWLPIPGLMGGPHPNPTQAQEDYVNKRLPMVDPYIHGVRRNVAELAGGMAGGEFFAGASKGLPWLMRLLASSSGAGAGMGVGGLVTGEKPKEALHDAAVGTLFTGAAEGATAGVLKATEKVAGSKLVKEVLKSKVTQLEEKHAAEAAQIKADYDKELAAHQEEVSKIQKVNEQKMAEHQERLNRIEQRYQKKVAEHQAKVQEADLEYKKRVEEHKQKVADVKRDYAQKLAQHEKATKDVSVKQSQAQAKQGLALEHQNEMAGLVKENLELTKEKINKELGAEFDAVNDAVQKRNPTVKVANAEREARGHLYNPDSVAAFNNIMENVSGKLKMTDFGILRKAYSNLNEILYGNRELPPDLYQAVKVVRDSLGKDLQAAANKVGLGGKYSKVMADYGDFKDVWDDTSAIAKGGSPIRKVLDAKDPAYVIDQFKGKAGDRLVDDIGKYAKYGGDKALAGQLKGFIEKVESFPSTAPELPKAPSRPSFPKEPERGAAPKAPEAPYKPKAPTLRDIPKAPEPPQLTPFDREAVARAILADRIKKAIMYGGAAAGGGYLYELLGKKTPPVP